MKTEKPTDKHCVLCGKQVDLEDGKYKRHFRTIGRRQLCLNSGQNALTASELGWGRYQRRIR